MMMCRDDTTQQAGPTDSLVESKRMTGTRIKEEKAIPSLVQMVSPSPSADGGHADNGIAVKVENSEQSCEPLEEQQETKVDVHEDSVMEQATSLDFKPYNHADKCEQNPEFAVVCSFILQFGEKLDLALNIEQLKTSIEDQTRIDESLIDLHVKLLKKIRRYFVRDLWEKALIRYVSEYSYEDAYELESLGYQKTRPSIKLQLLRRLMDAQFEHDQKFKAAVNQCDANDLRLLPTGRDLRGNTYWYQSDSEGNLRIFQEQPLDFKSWTTVCSNVTELNALIERLDKEKEDKVKGEPISEPYNPLPEIFPELFVKEETIEEKKPIETKVSKTKKGRNKGRGKKNEPLPILKENDDESSNLDNKEIVLNAPNNNINRPITNGFENLSKTIESTDEESQVKSILDCILSRVISTVGYFIRPHSRNSEQQVRQESKEEAQLEQIPATKATKKRATKRDKPKEEVLPRRSSSRIQQLQQKKIAEQEEEMKKMIESNAAKKANSVASSLDDDSRSRTGSSRANRKRSESPENPKKNSKKRRKKDQSWKRGKGKKKLSWDKDDSDLSSTSSITESNDEDDLDFGEDSFKLETNDYDDEFACEDEETNIEPVIIKRARTAKQNTVQDQLGDLNESSIVEEDKPCGRCDKSNDPEWILLCDMCDDGYHTSCCLPPLMIVPDGDWFCPPCEHKMLLTKLREFHSSISELIETKERERKKTQRLRHTTVKKESIKSELTEIPEKRSRNFLHELNEPLALQELDEELDKSEEGSRDSYEPRSRTRKKAQRNRKGGYKRPAPDNDDANFSINYKKTRKTYSRRNPSEEEDSDDEILGGMSSNYSSEEEDEVEEEEEELPKTRRARASVSYRFQEYDDLIKSAIQRDSYDDDDDDNDEESERESTPEENCNYGKGKDMATIEALAYQQENGILEHNSLPADTDNVDSTSTKPRAKPRKKTRRLNDLDAASESGNTTSDESFQASSATEAEDDELTEAEISGDSDTSIDELVLSKSNRKKKKKRRMSYESDDSDYQPTRGRRAASKRVSYKESTEDEDSEAMVSSKAKKKNTLSSDEDTQASWKSESESIGNDDDRSTSCVDSPDTGADLIINEEHETDISPAINGPDQKQTVGPPSQKPLLSVSTPIPASQPRTSATYAVEAKKARIENSNHTLPHTSTQTNCSVLEESFDEIAAPLYSKTSPVPPKAISPNLDAAHRPEQQNAPRIVNADKARDPIRELIQYCSESANSPSMFNSYNQTLSNKDHQVSSGPPVHPPFYNDDDLK